MGFDLQKQPVVEPGGSAPGGWMYLCHVHDGAQLAPAVDTFCQDEIPYFGGTEKF